MKCPNCRFVCSDLRDICPHCTFDLRPQKKIIGIKIVNSSISYEELLSSLSKRSKKKKVKAKPTLSEKGIEPELQAQPHKEPEPKAAPIQREQQREPEKAAEVEVQQSRVKDLSGVFTRFLSKLKPEIKAAPTAKPLGERELEQAAPNPEVALPKVETAPPEPESAPPKVSTPLPEPEQAPPAQAFTPSEQPKPEVLDLSNVEDFMATLDQFLDGSEIEFEPVKSKPKEEDLQFEIEIEAQTEAEVEIAKETTKVDQNTPAKEELSGTTETEVEITTVDQDSPTETEPTIEFANELESSDETSQEPEIKAQPELPPSEVTPPEPILSAEESIAAEMLPSEEYNEAELSATEPTIEFTSGLESSDETIQGAEIKAQPELSQPAETQPEPILSLEESGSAEIPVNEDFKNTELQELAPKDPAKDLKSDAPFLAPPEPPALNLFSKVFGAIFSKKTQVASPPPGVSVQAKEASPSPSEESTQITPPVAVPVSSETKIITSEAQLSAEIEITPVAPPAPLLISYTPNSAPPPSIIAKYELSVIAEPPALISLGAEPSNSYELGEPATAAEEAIETKAPTPQVVYVPEVFEAPVEEQPELISDQTTTEEVNENFPTISIIKPTNHREPFRSTPVFEIDDGAVQALFDMMLVELDSHAVDIELCLENLAPFQISEEILVLFDLAEEVLDDAQAESKYQDLPDTTLSRTVTSDSLAKELQKTEAESTPEFSLAKGYTKKLHQDSHKTTADEWHAQLEERFGSRVKEILLPSLVRRTAAFIIDQLIVIAIAAVLSLTIVFQGPHRDGVVAILLGNSPLFADATVLYGVFFALILLTTAIYPLLSTLIFGKSIGLISCNLSIYKENGTRVEWPHLILRSATFPTSMLFFGYLPILFGRRSLHDKIAKTVVGIRRGKKISYSSAEK